MQLEDTAKDIYELERTLADLEQQKSEQCNLLKRALTEEDRRKHSQQTFSKEPSWTSLYPASKSTNIFSFSFLNFYGNICMSKTNSGLDAIVHRVI